MTRIHVIMIIHRVSVGKLSSNRITICYYTNVSEKNTYLKPYSISYLFEKLDLFSIETE